MEDYLVRAIASPNNTSSFNSANFGAKSPKFSLPAVCIPPHFSILYNIKYHFEPTQSQYFLLKLCTKNR